MAIISTLIGAVANLIGLVFQAGGVTVGILLGLLLVAWATSGCKVMERDHDKVKYIVVSPAHVAPAIPPAVVPSGPSN